MSKQIDIILNCCIEVMGDSFLEKNKQRDNAFKRAIFYKCCKQLTKESLELIGKAVGRDHATVLYGLNTIFPNDIQSGNFPDFFHMYRKCIRLSTVKINHKYASLTKEEKMIHTIINQRGYIKDLEGRLSRIPDTVKTMYA